MDHLTGCICLIFTPHNLFIQRSMESEHFQEIIHKILRSVDEINREAFDYKF